MADAAAATDVHSRLVNAVVWRAISAKVRCGRHAGLVVINHDLVIVKRSLSQPTKPIHPIRGQRFCARLAKVRCLSLSFRLPAHF